MRPAASLGVGSDNIERVIVVERFAQKVPVGKTKNGSWN